MMFSVQNEKKMMDFYLDEMKNRRVDIDIAKAIGIIMVVWAHAGGPFSSYITSFHMPLFFFLSGILFKPTSGYKVYVERKFHSLLVPFWTWNFLLLVPFWVLYYWGDWNLNILLKYIFAIGFTLDKVPMLGATWFLPALFWISCSFISIYVLMDKLGKGKDIVIFLLGILACCIGMSISFPYRISRVLICSMFYVLGYLYNKYIQKYFQQCFISNIIAIIFLMLFICFTSMNSISLGNASFRFPFLFVVGACLGIFVVIVISKDITLLGSENILIKHLIFIGKNTMPIVIWQFVFFRMAILLQIVTCGAPLKSLASFPIYDGSDGWWILYILTGIYGSLIWNFVLKKVKQWVVKKERNRKKLCNT